MSVFDNEIRGWIREAIHGEFSEVVQRLGDLAANQRNSDSGLPVFLTADEVAKLTKVRPQTVRSWVSSKLLPAHYAGRKLRIRLDELEAFMLRERDQPTTDLNDDADRVREILASIDD